MLHVVTELNLVPTSQVTPEHLGMDYSVHLSCQTVCVDEEKEMALYLPKESPKSCIRARAHLRLSCWCEYHRCVTITAPHQQQHHSDDGIQENKSSFLFFFNYMFRFFIYINAIQAITHAARPLFCPICLYFSHYPPHSDL